MCLYLIPQQSLVVDGSKDFKVERPGGILLINQVCLCQYSHIWMFSSRKLIGPHKVENCLKTLHKLMTLGWTYWCVFWKTATGTSIVVLWYCTMKRPSIRLMYCLVREYGTSLLHIKGTITRQASQVFMQRESRLPPRLTSSCNKRVLRLAERLLYISLAPKDVVGYLLNYVF